MYIPPSSVTSYLRFSSVLFFVNLALCLASAMPMDGYSGLTSFLFLGTKRGLSNLQMFTAALGGIIAAPITMSTNAKRPYEVDGDTFPDFATAASRSCDVQHNSCCDAANAKKGNFTTNDCDTQLCKSIPFPQSELN